MDGIWSKGMMFSQQCATFKGSMRQSTIRTQFNLLFAQSAKKVHNSKVGLTTFTISCSVKLFWLCLGTFWLSPLGGTAGFELVETRDAAKHLTVVVSYRHPKILHPQISIILR